MAIREIKIDNTSNIKSLNEINLDLALAYLEIFG